MESAANAVIREHNNTYHPGQSCPAEDDAGECAIRTGRPARPEWPAASAEGLDVHAALNTYEVALDVPEGAAEELNTLAIVGANHRRLIARWTSAGVWVGGCLITDEAVADRLAAFITREDETQ